MKNYLIALAALSLIFAGCASSGNDADQEDVDLEVVEDVELDEDGKSGEEETQEEAEEVGTDSTGEWANFTSTSLGFTMEYPADWTAKMDDHGRSFMTVTSPARLSEAEKYMDMGGFIGIDVQIKTYDSYLDLPNNDDELTLDEWVATENSYFEGGDYSSITIDGRDGYLISYSNILLGDDYRFVMFEYKGKIYELNFNVPNEETYVIERNHMMDSFNLL